MPITLMAVLVHTNCESYFRDNKIVRAQTAGVLNSATQRVEVLGTESDSIIPPISSQAAAPPAKPHAPNAEDGGNRQFIPNPSPSTPKSRKTAHSFGDPNAAQARGDDFEITAERLRRAGEEDQRCLTRSQGVRKRMAAAFASGRRPGMPWQTPHFADQATQADGGAATATAYRPCARTAPRGGSNSAADRGLAPCRLRSRPGAAGGVVDALWQAQDTCWCWTPKFADALIDRCRQRKGRAPWCTMSAYAPWVHDDNFCKACKPCWRQRVLARTALRLGVMDGQDNADTVFQCVHPAGTPNQAVDSIARVFENALWPATASHANPTWCRTRRHDRGQPAQHPGRQIQVTWER